MDFTVRKLTPNVGVEISGLDLRRPLDPATMAEVRKVWLDNVVVVIPDQPIDDDQQIAFSRQVGALELINMSALLCKCPAGRRFTEPPTWTRTTS